MSQSRTANAGGLNTHDGSLTNKAVAEALEHSAKSGPSNAAHCPTSGLSMNPMPTGRTPSRDSNPPSGAPKRPRAAKRPASKPAAAPAGETAKGRAPSKSDKAADAQTPPRSSDSPTSTKPPRDPRINTRVAPRTSERECPPASAEAPKEVEPRPGLLGRLVLPGRRVPPNGRLQIQRSTN